MTFRRPTVCLCPWTIVLRPGERPSCPSRLPPDNPYKRERRPDDVEDHGDAAEAPQDSHRQPWPSSPAEAEADAAMAEAARAVAQGTADDDQRRRAVAMDDARTHEERRAIWMGFDAPGSGPGQPPHRAVA